MARQPRAGPRTDGGRSPGGRARRVPRRALFAGSFDPITFGHLDLITRGLALFDQLVVAVGSNPAKRYRLSLERRLALVREVVDDPAVEVVSFDGLLVTAARAHGATFCCAASARRRTWSRRCATRWRTAS
jgi:cytidyltransferase-like protein